MHGQTCWRKQCNDREGYLALGRDPPGCGSPLSAAGWERTVPAGLPDTTLDTSIFSAVHPGAVRKHHITPDRSTVSTLVQHISRRIYRLDRIHICSLQGVLGIDAFRHKLQYSVDQCYSKIYM